MTPYEEAWEMYQASHPEAVETTFRAGFYSALAILDGDN